MEVLFVSKKRVHELSKELGVSNTELLAKLAEIGIEVKNHMSGLEDDQINRIKKAYNADKNSESVKPQQEKKDDNNISAKSDINEKKETKENKSKGPRLFVPKNSKLNRNDKNEKNNNKEKNRFERGQNGKPQSGTGNNYQDRSAKKLNQGNPNKNENTRGNEINREKTNYKANQGFNENRHTTKDNKKFSVDKVSFSASERNNSRSRQEKPAKAKIGFETKPSREQRSQQEKKNKNNFSRNKNDINDNNDRFRSPKKNNKPKKQEQPKKEPVQEVFEIQIPEQISIKSLAEKLKVAPSSIVMRLMKMGIMANINQEIDFDTVEELCLEMNVLVEHAKEIDIFEEAFKEEEDNEKDLVERPPVVVVMGHVDHGKTSLLDAIRHSNVTGKEAGGITQHIGAYTVSVNKKPITFLDTPGHEAFTAMRMRGAQVTDIAILVVAADDGVMPQTIEAINHAKAAGVEIIVAINKIDKPGANPDRVKQELVEYGLVAEDWGGDTICVPVSAQTKEGLDQLLEMIILVSELKELKANPNKMARGNIIEAQLDKGRGAVATVLIQSGTLNVGDPVVAGGCYGKIRAMINDKGQKVKKAGPSIPVEILGLNEVPSAGDMFYVAENERKARQVAESVLAKDKRDMVKDTPQKVSLDDLFSRIESGNLKELNIVIKADVQGSVEAVKSSLEKLSNDEVRIRTIHGGVGAITESDVMLASASNAIIIGFNVRPEASAKSVADEQKVDIRLYRVIYNAIEDITAAMKGLLDPVFEEKIIGHAQIRQLFKASGVGTIGGSYVQDGVIQRNCQVRILRDNVVVYEGELASLRRGKDDVKEVKTSFECGLLFNKFNDIKEGDIVEAYIMEEVKR